MARNNSTIAGKIVQMVSISCASKICRLVYLLVIIIIKA